jgi:2-polyprenyl-3-methyl-5-hydroxy-6-metoxy-1,4-benzoquinol methylase
MVSDERRLQLNRQRFSGQIQLQRQAYETSQPQDWQKLWRVRQASALATLSALLPPAARVLDVGCGTGQLALALAAQGYRLTAVDLIEGMLEAGRQANPDIEWVHAPFSDRLAPRATFDAVVALGYLEYQERTGKELVRMGRLLKPGGLLLLSVPNTLSRQFGYGVTRALYRLGKEPESFAVRHSFTPERLQRHLGMAGYILMDYEWLSPDSLPVCLRKDRARPFWAHRVRDRFQPEMLTLSRSYRRADTSVGEETGS